MLIWPIFFLRKEKPSSLHELYLISLRLIPVSDGDGESSTSDELIMDRSYTKKELTPFHNEVNSTSPLINNLKFTTYVVFFDQSLPYHSINVLIWNRNVAFRISVFPYLMVAPCSYNKVPIVLEYPFNLLVIINFHSQ